MKSKLIMAAVLFMATSAWYSERDQGNWDIVQITKCAPGKNYSPRVSADGKTIFFISNCDLDMSNSDHWPEIFKYDVEGKEITQITDNQYCSTSELALAPDDKRLAFSTNCELSGQNPNRGQEIAYMDLSGEVKVLTRGTGYMSRRPAWSSDGKYLVFESMADLTQKNSDHSLEIFLADFSSSPPQIKQISKTMRPLGCENPQMAGDSILCRCNDDLPGTRRSEGGMSDLPMTMNGRTVGGNPDHNYEIIRFDLSGKPRQLTYTKGCENSPPVLHPQGRMVVLVSGCNLTEEKNWNSRMAMYLYSTEFILPFPEIKLYVSEVAWSRDGKWLALSSNYGNIQVNPGRNVEIFMVDMSLDKLQGPWPEEALMPVTESTYAASKQQALNKNGKVVVFVADSNYMQSNANVGSEIFMAVRQSNVTEGE